MKTESSQLRLLFCWRDFGARLSARVRERPINLLRVLLLCCAITTIPKAVLAQEGWVPVGPPNWIGVSLQTIGGITYFTHTSSVPICHRVASGPLARSGTNLTQVINEEAWTGPCDPCPGCTHEEIHVSVFGALPSGDYFFEVLSW